MDEAHPHEQARLDSKHATVSGPGMVDQSSRLPLRKILLIFSVLQLVLFISYMDQTFVSSFESVSTVLPVISNDLGSADEIGWVGTSFLIATCSSQMILARFSDIFGRKVMLTAVIVIFAFGNILSGFSQNAIWLFSARERGRYQGLLSIAIGLGNGLGPLIGKPLPGNSAAKVKQVDFVGSFLSMASSGWVHYGQLYFQEYPRAVKRNERCFAPPYDLSSTYNVFFLWTSERRIRSGYVVPLMQLGFTIWVVAAGLLYRFDVDTLLGYVIGTLVVAGISVGMTMQTSLVSAQAGAPSRDRAVVTGARNTARSLGGAIGLAACGTIRNSLTRMRLAQVPGISSQIAETVVTSGLSAVQGDLDAQTVAQLKSAVMYGIHGVYLSFIPLIASAMLLSWLVPNHRIFEKKKSDSKDVEAQTTSQSLGVGDPIDQTSEKSRLSSRSNHTLNVSEIKSPTENTYTHADGIHVQDSEEESGKESP
ncbi:MFS general substrate transporter [Gymnopus androsaceus JB14]|uniref:MFS general substrate transporter n=1 Tax=Gymnopus androsaceus JB14 TaxID=1447944 RepID=A0A6A4I4U6_9AGAR|nr:MFS general substrate transporter [Gymnopus androsaceus JB14]